MHPWLARLLAVLCLAVASLSLHGQQGTPGQRFSLPSRDGLLRQSDFVYIGSFRLPSGSYGSLPDTSNFALGWVGGLVYNDPVNGKSLFIKGDKAAQDVTTTASMAQVVIPALLDPTQVGGVSGLNTATHVQGFADASGGQSASILIGNGLGTSVVYGGKLIGLEFVGYDANCQQTKLGWVGSLTFGGQTGPYAFSNLPYQRFAGKYATVIPVAYRTALGGSLIAGANGGSIVSCGPNGPGLFALDGDTLITQPSSATTITAQPLAYYDNSHANLGAWNSNDPTQNCTSVSGTWPNGGGTCTNTGNVPTITFTNAHAPIAHIADTVTLPYEDNAGPLVKSAGILFPDNSRSVLVFGSKAIGAYFYKPCTQSSWPVTGTDCGGAPCNDAAYAGHPYAYDPDLANCSETGGDFAWPSTEFVWAFDALDLAAVKAGTKNAWDVVPYTGWSFKVFGDGDGSGVGCGAAWDPDLRYAYLVCEFGDGNQPLVHAFRVSTPH